MQVDAMLPLRIKGSDIIIPASHDPRISPPFTCSNFADP
jgi:hypothetical protein